MCAIKISGVITNNRREGQQGWWKEFYAIFQKQTFLLLKQHVIEPVKNGKITGAWTNNNCESPNHILKSATNWKLQDIPKFIDALYGIVKSEQVGKCRAIRDMGNNRLADRYSHHMTDISY